VILRKRAVKEKGVVVETSTHSVNRKNGGFDRGDKTFSLRYHDGCFFPAGPC